MVYLNGNPDGDDVDPLKYRYAQYLEDSYQLKQAKRMYMKLLTSRTSYKDSAYASVRRLREVLGTPESLAEKVAYAKLACTKDEMKNCIDLLDSIQILDALQAQFPGFLTELVPGNPMKAEFLLPRSVDALLKAGKATVKVLRSADKWYGVTYAADKPVVVAALAELTRQGMYPDGLWK
jgi:hypothetical protein